MHVAAEPNNYKIWYRYSEGTDCEMNRAVNSLLDEKGHLDDIDHTQIIDHYFSSLTLTDQTEVIGEKISDQIRDLLNVINDSILDTEKFCDSLEGAQEKLGEARSLSEVIGVVAGIVKETKSVELHNRELEKQLKVSGDKIEALNDDLEEARNESLRDSLTRLGNRKHFDQSINALIKRAETDQETFSLLVIDIDHFKTFNDLYGHQTGDRVLHLTGIVLQRTIKGQDIACRYGGEEFMILLPRTSLMEATLVAENVRLSIMHKELVRKSTGENLGSITVSIGVAEYQAGESAIQLIERADQSLYDAKRTGRNRVVKAPLDHPSAAKILDPPAGE